MPSREGNVIPPLGSQIREGMPKESLCRTCAHTLDRCETIEKVQRKTKKNYTAVYWCAGFDEVTPNEKIQGGGQA